LEEQYINDSININYIENLNLFNEIKIFTYIDLKNDVLFWEKYGILIEMHNNCFIKSYIIKTQLNLLKYNDIIIYTDINYEINKHDKERLIEYIDMLNMNKEEYGIISFQSTDEKKYHNKELLDIINYKEEFSYIDCSSKILIIKKNEHSMNIINIWNEFYDKNILNNFSQDYFHSSIKKDDQLYNKKVDDEYLLSILLNKYGSIKLLDEHFLF
jgi:hypothetical protein